MDSNNESKKEQETKDCCASVNHSAYYEITHICQDPMGLLGDINQIDFADCCGSRGSGTLIES
jgi:hypothetical protein